MTHTIVKRLTHPNLSLANKQTLLKAVSFALGTLLSLMLVNQTVYANDSVGYVGAGGVQYIKSDAISMHKEDLFISKDEIRVDYEFLNLSNRDVTETVLFPLPAVPAVLDYDYADTNAMYNNFKVWVNGRSINPTLHVRTYMTPIMDSYDPSVKSVDTTALFKSCGVSEREMMLPWLQEYWSKDYERGLDIVNRKIKACDNPKLSSFVHDVDYIDFEWHAQLIYSWEQTFKANSTTYVKHSYAPLVGGGSMFSVDYEGDTFCVDDSIKRYLHDDNIHSYSALSYILTTGANWANPIDEFTLTVKRDAGEVVSFCWAGEGQVRKIAPGTFQIKERNFVPTKDFDVAFIKRYEF